MSKKQDIQLETLKKVEKQFTENKAWTKRGLVSKLNIHFYAIKSAIEYLLNQDKIVKLESSNRGELFIKND